MICNLGNSFKKKPALTRVGEQVVLFMETSIAAIAKD